MDDNAVSIPLSPEWDQQEIIAVVDFFTQIEKIYERGANAGAVADAYNKFKRVVPAKSEEKTHFKAYDEQTGTSTWKAVKAAMESETHETIKLTR